MNPTFALFKQQRQESSQLHSRNKENKMQAPKTFQEIKRTKFRASKDHNIAFNIVCQGNKHAINFSKHSNSQLKFRDSPKGYKHFAIINKEDQEVQDHRKSAKDKANGGRPNIIAPTILKKKLCIQRNQFDKVLRSKHPAHSAKPFDSLSNIDTYSVFQKSSDGGSASIGSSLDKSSDNGCFNLSTIDNSVLNSIDSDRERIPLKPISSLEFSRETQVNGQSYDPQSYQSVTETPKASEGSFALSNSPNLFSDCQEISNSLILNEPPSGNDNSVSFLKKFKFYRENTSKSVKPLSLDQFSLIQEIGEGKYGKVFMARHKTLNFICALKSVSKAIIREQKIEEPFLREIKIQMYLNHPNVVKLFEFFCDRENIYLIMEYCEGGHLLKRIQQKRTFEEKEILGIVFDVFEAVSYLHCHGIIHRDLKPENIVIQNGVFKICDFGWAAYAKGDTRTTFCGTPLYVSPQVLKGEEYNVKADIWGLGVLLYELAYGRVPFPIWNQSDMLKIVKDPVYYPRWANVPEKMQQLIRSMLTKNPEMRPSLNQILSSTYIVNSAGVRVAIRSEIESLF